MVEFERLNQSDFLLGRTNQVRMYYFWDMSNKHTFLIPTIKMILKKYNVGKGWIDPFANKHSPAEITNDINKDMPTDYHLDSLEFVNLFSEESKDGALLDPPYSMNQAVHTYKGKRLQDITPVYNQVSKIIKYGGVAICFGWNSNGLGLQRNFLTEEIYLIAHGGNHNDTIVTVQRKIDRSNGIQLF